ncbi:MAG: helicase-related protein, partial [Bacteroidota bacterium]|nr:helicase-related protein [Bacteroidota bacterium]
RFAGRAPEDGETVDVSDVMRRMVKEELLKFDGTPLFPKRMAYTACYELSAEERNLYESVTQYVRDEMNRAQKLDDKRKGNVGFALTQLQRRLASSPEAIYQSLKRRHKKLDDQREELKKIQQGNHVAEVFNGYQTFADIPDDADEAFDEMEGGDYENWADQVVNRASAAQTAHELEAEIATLKVLEEQARKVVHSEKDRKWEQLSSLLQDTPEMFDESGSRRKLIIFTEHRDTLNYLNERITKLIGSQDAVVTIHGGVSRDARRKVQEEFWHNSEVLVLVATDAAGEGVNLQKANLMVNYDLPWNPNRIEQRFGRIHRIGQREVCHLWNMLAKNTREGDVFERLFTKLQVESEALGGSVFDVLGDMFDEVPLKDLLIKAIVDGESPETRAYLDTVIDSALDREHIRDIMRKHALVAQHMSMEELYAVKEDMEKAEARKLQPYFVRAFFLDLFEKLQGDVRERERNRYEVRHVPSDVREWDRSFGQSRTPVVQKYERICFEKDLLFVRNKPQAVLMHPGHPLMLAMTNLLIGRTRGLLRQGTVLVDPTDEGTEPGVLLMLDHKVRESATEKVVSRRLQF